MMPWLWLWWQGYVTVRLRGVGVERVLTRAAQAGVHLFRVQRLTADLVVVRLPVQDFRRLRPLLREDGRHLSVSILDRHGWPFLLRRLKGRLFLAVGLGLAALAVAYLANFIWFIEVVGADDFTLELIRAVVEETGLRSGVKRSFLDARALEQHLLERLPHLAWVHVKSRGIKAEIHVLEREASVLDSQGAGHIYAKRDGLVTEVLVLQGTARVREGDTVRKDDLLISGMYYDQQGRRQFGAARGIVKARVWYQAVGESSLVQWEPVKTGKRHRQFRLTVGPLSIPLGRSYPRDNHLVTTRNWQLSLGSALAPLSWSCIDYEEVQWQKIPVPLTEAQRAAYELAWETLLAQGVEIDQVLEEKRTVDYLNDGDGIRVTVQVEVLEDIGQFLGQ
ncbi:MAG TPA: sporulation protein YqfD [Limnochordia bacterium]|nr:sporulation protein YqfD [Limnochordia bacterium]